VWSLGPVKETARGGMGQIYFGEDPPLEMQVAIKVSSLAEGGMENVCPNRRTSGGENQLASSDQVV
jgi:hypothetical protein